MPSVFVVAATVVAIVNGAPVNDLFPDGNIRYNVSNQFQSRDACNEYRNSDRFKLAKQELAAMVVGKFDAEHVPDLTITDVCHEFVSDPKNPRAMIDKDTNESSRKKPTKHDDGF